MKQLFKDIIAIDGVKGILLFSTEGRLHFHELNYPFHENPTRQDWSFLTSMMKDVREADLIYENSRFYLRSTTAGYLLVVMERATPISLVRLSCDMAIPALKKQAVAPKGIMRFFKRK